MVIFLPISMKDRQTHNFFGCSRYIPTTWDVPKLSLAKPYILEDKELYTVLVRALLFKLVSIIILPCHYHHINIVLRRILPGQTYEGEASATVTPQQRSVSPWHGAREPGFSLNLRPLRTAPGASWRAAPSLLACAPAPPLRRFPLTHSQTPGEGGEE